MQERNYQLDNIKVILIFLVVLGHIIESSSNTGIIAYVHYAIYTFHMPIFILILGYFVNLDKPDYWKNFKIYLIFQLLYSVAWVFIFNKFNEISFQFLIQILLQPRWILWFIFAVPVLKLLLVQYKKNDLSKIIIWLVVIGFNFFNFNFYILQIGRILSYFPLYLLGHTIKQNNFDLKKLKLSKVPLVISILITLIVWFELLNLVPYQFLYGSFPVIYFTNKVLIGILIKFALYGFGLFILIILISIVPNKNLRITKIGKSTLPVYLYHGLFVWILYSINFYGVFKGSPQIFSLGIDVLIAISLVYILQMLPVLGAKSNKIRWFFFSIPWNKTVYKRWKIRRFREKIIVMN